jgi:hypothetical protein
MQENERPMNDQEVKLYEDILNYAAHKFDDHNATLGGAARISAVISNMLKLSIDCMLSAHFTITEGGKNHGRKYIADDCLIDTMNRILQVMNINATVVKTRIDPDILLKHKGDPQ